MGAAALENYAIVVGVTYAPDSGLNPLAGTQRDTAAFMEWLLAPDGGDVPIGNVVQLSLAGDPGSLPGQDRIDATLTALGINGRQRPIGRRLYFYFSGHGYGTDWDQICMLMDGYTSKKPEFNIGLRDYRSFMRALPFFEEVIYILDCCRNRSAKPAVGRAPTLPLPAATAEEEFKISDVIVAAAPTGFKSFEITDPETGLRRGLFTLALLELLRGPLGVDPRGRHAANNLQENLRFKAAAIVERHGFKNVNVTQDPTLNISDDRGTGLVFAQSEITEVMVRITAPDGAKGQLVVYDNNKRKVDQCSAAKATKDKPPWRVPLELSRWYSVRHTRGQTLDIDAPIEWFRLKGPDKDGAYEFVLPKAKLSRRRR